MPPSGEDSTPCTDSQKTMHFLTTLLESVEPNLKNSSNEKKSDTKRRACKY